MFSLPEHLILPLVFIEVNVVLSFVSYYFMCFFGFLCCVKITNTIMFCNWTVYKQNRGKLFFFSSFVFASQEEYNWIFKRKTPVFWKYIYIFKDDIYQIFKILLYLQIPLLPFLENWLSMGPRCVIWGFCHVVVFQTDFFS